MKKYFVISILVLAVVASYAPAVRNGFVWDDTALILRDPLIRSWRLIPEGFNHFLFVDATASDFYRPIQRLTYTLEYAAFAFRPAPYHVTSILCHATAAIALLFFAEEFLLAFGMEERKRRMLALIAALVWAIHPVQSAAVVYVSGRADSLAAIFGFLGCYLIFRSLRTSSRGNLALLIGAGVALLLSALSKETGLIFPALVIVVLALMKHWGAVLKSAVIAAFICVIYLSLRLPAEHNPPPVLGTRPPLATRPIVVARAFAEYTGLLVFPVNLHMEREVEAQLSPNADIAGVARRELQTLLGISLLVASVCWGVRARRREPAAFALLVLAALSYLPMSGMMLLNASVAEHWLYLPSAFLFLAAAVTTWRFFEGHEARTRIRHAIPVALACWVMFLGARTFIRTFDWKDQRTFLERTIAQGGDSARMLINLGGFELGEGRLDLAKKHLQAALRKEPDQPLAVINLATLALKQNELKVARNLLTHAVRMPLVEAHAHELLAVLENKENGRANLLRLRLAARTGPPNWAIEKRYIKLLHETGATPAAIIELKTCLVTGWYRAETWQLLSQLFLKTGRAKEAAIALAYANNYDVHLAKHRHLL